MAVVAAVIAVVLALVAGTALFFALRDSDSRAGDSTGGKGDRDNSSPSPSPSRSPTTSPTPKPNEIPAAGIWVAQLASVEKSRGTAARDRQEEALRDEGLSEIAYVDSSAHASLRPGYWMFYVPGFNDGAAAVSWCRTNGLGTKNECVGRYVSDNASDSKYLCDPAAGSGTSGRCTRP